MSRPDDFDARLRRIHGASLDALSPRVLAQLAQRRHAALATALRPGRARWGWTGAAVTACVLVVALQVRPPIETPAPTPAALASADAPSVDPGGVLAEDPDFYLWLASGESQAYAVE